MSDKNNIPFNVVKFKGIDKSSLSEKVNYGSQNILFVYEQIKNRLQSENISISNTSVRPRKDIYLYDFDSVNEAVINALVHNDYSISQPLISFFLDRLEILSHGGLPIGQSKESFFKGISRPRNDMLSRIFQDMGLMEHTGHGIPTIVKKYGKEAFDITDAYVNVVIPYEKVVADVFYERTKVGLNVGLNVGLSEIEKKVLESLVANGEYTAILLSKKLGVSERTIERAFAKLQKLNMIIRNGSKRDGKWIVLK